MTPEPMVIRNHGYRGLEKLDQKMVPCTAHKPGQISSKNILVPFSGPEFCALSSGKGLRLPGSQDYGKNLKKL